MVTENKSELVVWRLSMAFWVMTGCIVLFMGYVYQYSIADLLMNWEKEEYSHGYLIPLIALFLILQKRDKYELLIFDGSWFGVVLMIIGLFLYAVGTFGAVVDVISYGFVISISGIFLAFTGVKAYKIFFPALFLLLFMIPLPSFLYGGLSSELQLISSKIGVALIRLFNISVYLEGNVIDLGLYKLQVVEACSGLRYLFPLVTLGLIAAYFFKVEFWKRTIIFLSSIPITILMNSIRIGLIGVSVEYWGIEMAEGILHDFEGWVVFMGCIAILLLEMFILVNVGKDRKKLADAFGIEFPPPTSISTQKQYRSIPKPFIVVFIILMTFSLSIIGMPERKDIIPERQQYSSFPMQLGEWSGKAGIMEQDIIDTLGLDDYIMADYSNSQNQDSVNFYSGYYSVQRSNKVPHSPKRCIPGGGWQISSIDRYEVQGVKINDNKLFVNRLIIRKGEQSQLVYYWFQQRHRVITNEYLVKWYLLIDSIFDRRTDGALMRLITFVDQNDSFEEADQRLTDFASKISPIVAEYVPD